MSKSEKLRVALVQSDIVWEDIHANLAQFSTKINSISSEVDLIVLPEMFSTGFTMNAKKLAETMNGKTVSWMQNLAQEKQAVISGSVIVSVGPFDPTKGDIKYYNRLLFVYPSGKIEFYDKRHTFTLASEHETFSTGNERKIFELNGWKICPLICYDLRFPVWARNTDSYNVLLYVASWPKKRISAWDALLKARAIENISYTIGVNRVGLDGNNFEYVGHSIAYDSIGNPLSEEDNEKEEIILVELDKLQQQNVREKFGFLNDRDDFTIN